MPFEAIDPSADKWSTYKDYLKRKRDYKREWRKRKNPTTVPVKRTMASQPEVARNHILTDSSGYRTIHAKRKVHRAASPLEQVVEQLFKDARVQEEEEHHEEPLDVKCNIIAVGDEEEEEELNHYNEIPEGFQEAEAQEEDHVEMTKEEEEQEQEEHVLSHDDIEFTERWNTVYTRLVSLQDTGRRSRYLKIIEDIVGELW